MQKRTYFVESFLKRFPVPGYVAVPSTGVDISDNSVKWMSFVDDHKGGVRIINFGAEKLPDGLVVKGIIEKPKELSALLAALQKKEGFRYVRASLPEEKAFLFTLSVPNDLADSEIYELIGFKLEENVPIALDDAVFDFDRITPETRKGSHKTHSQKEQQIVVSVFPKDIAYMYTDIFLDAGMQPLSFEIEAQAIARAVVSEDDASTYMIVDFGRARSGLSIVAGNAVVFTTTIGIGGDVITQAVKEAYPDASEDTIEHIKREQGCLPTSSNKDLCMSLLSVVTALKDEINRHLVYWQTHEKKENQQSVTEIQLCGGNANLAGLTDYLSQTLNMPTRHTNVWSNTNLLSEDNIPPIDKYHSLSYASAIGLALHHTAS